MSRLSDRRNSDPDQESLEDYLARIGVLSDEAVAKATAHYNVEELEER